MTDFKKSVQSSQLLLTLRERNLVSGGAAQLQSTLQNCAVQGAIGVLMKLLNDNPAPALAKVQINTLGRLVSSEEVSSGCLVHRLVRVA